MQNYRANSYVFKNKIKCISLSEFLSFFNIRVCVKKRKRVTYDTYHRFFSKLFLFYFILTIALTPQSMAFIEVYL